jgi:hypothetical protein
MAVCRIASNRRAHLTERERISQTFKLPVDRLAHGIESLERLA